MGGFKAAHRDISTDFTTDHREINPDRRDFEIWIAFTDQFNETRHVETRFGETLLAVVCSPAVLKVQGKPQARANLRSWVLLYGLQWKSSPQQKTHKCERRPAGRERGWRRGSNQAETKRGLWGDPPHRSRRKEQETEPDHRAGAEETNHKRRSHWRRKSKQPEAGRRRQHEHRKDPSTRDRPRGTLGRPAGRLPRTHASCRRSTRS